MRRVQVVLLSRSCDTNAVALGVASEIAADTAVIEPDSAIIEASLVAQDQFEVEELCRTRSRLTIVSERCTKYPPYKSVSYDNIEYPPLERMVATRRYLKKRKRYVSVQCRVCLSLDLLSYLTVIISIFIHHSSS